MKSSADKKYSYPGILIRCNSGRYLAFFDHRTDIIASGENEKEAKKNLKQMYKTVMEYEIEEEKEKLSEELPPNAEIKKFVQKV